MAAPRTKRPTRTRTARKTTKRPSPKARKVSATEAAEARAVALEIVRVRKLEARYHGVHYDRRARHWWLTFRLKGKRQSVVGFRTKAAAAGAREQLVVYYGANSGERNFPRRAVQPLPLSAVRQEVEAAKRGPSSRYRGVSRVPGTSTWRANVQVGKRVISASTWPTERAAAEAVDRAALHYLGSEAKLNFPEKARRLRPASSEALAEEAWLLRKRHTHSRFLGVTRDPSGVWCAVTTTLPQKRLGRFKAEVEAARAMDRYTKAQRLPNPRWNFDPVTGKPLYGRRRVDSAPAPKRAQGRAKGAK